MCKMNQITLNRLYNLSKEGKWWHQWWFKIVLLYIHSASMLTVSISQSDNMAKLKKIL